MADLSIGAEERELLARFLAGAKRPGGMRPGTWKRLLEEGLDVLEGPELRALTEAYPTVLVLLNVIGRTASLISSMDSVGGGKGRGMSVPFGL